MDIETIVHIINLILTPAVMISGCALVLNGLLQRYESIGGRLRIMHLELLDLLQKRKQDPTIQLTKAQYIEQERQAEIVEQIPRLMRRHRMVRNALQYVEVAIIMFVIDMLTITLLELIRAFASFKITILVGFFIGVSFLFIGLIISIIEVSHSHREVIYEAQRGLHLYTYETQEAK